jgi:opacity protein-like surface antigen
MFVRVGSGKAKTIESKRSVHGVTAQSTRKIMGLGGAALAFAVLSSSGAMAQCTSLPADPGGAAFTTFAATTASSLISTVNTINTAFLTQTTAFVSAPPNPQPDQTGAGVWVRGVGGRLTTNSNTTANWSFGTPGTSGVANCANSTRTTFGGVQAGSDYARLNWNGWNVHLGTTVGYGESTNTTGANQIKAEAPFAGVYAAATKGGFYIDGQVLGNYYNFATTDSTVGVMNQHTNGRGVSFAGSVGYNMPLKDNYFIEPSAGILWSRTEIDPINAAPVFAGPFTAPSTVSVNDVHSTLGHAGLRVGTSIVSGNMAWQPFAAASVWHEFASAATANSTTQCVASGLCVVAPGPEFTVSQSSTRVGTYGQYALGLAGTILNTGWVGYIRGDYRHGDNIDGWSLNTGLRYQFTPEAVAALTGKHPIYKAAPAVAVYDWTGFYIGANGGITNGSSTWTYVPGGPSISPKPKDSGGVLGGQVGYNRQFGKWVVGVEADADWTNAIGSKACPNASFFTCEVHLKWLASGTGRVGYTFWSDRVLTYLKGGVAAGSVTVQTVNNQGLAIPPSNTATNGTTATATGWTGGFGTEVGLTKNWSAIGEYMYYDLGSKNYVVDNGLVVNAHPKGGITRVGVNYRF